MDECEHCGITQEDYGCEFEKCNGEMLCEDCAEKEDKNEK